jgi:hypothetical protein
MLKIYDDPSRARDVQVQAAVTSGASFSCALRHLTTSAARIHARFAASHVRQRSALSATRMIPRLKGTKKGRDEARRVDRMLARNYTGMTAVYGYNLVQPRKCTTLRKVALYEILTPLLQTPVVALSIPHTSGCARCGLPATVAATRGDLFPHPFSIPAHPLLLPSHFDFPSSTTRLALCLTRSTKRSAVGVASETRADSCWPRPPLSRVRPGQHARCTARAFSFPTRLPYD